MFLVPNTHTSLWVEMVKKGGVPHHFSQFVPLFFIPPQFVGRLVPAPQAACRRPFAVCRAACVSAILVKVAVTAPRQRL